MISGFFGMNVDLPLKGLLLFYVLPMLAVSLSIIAALPL
jgi:Mg2+ and Co2+ transporter CorA